MLLCVFYVSLLLPLSLIHTYCTHTFRMNAELRPILDLLRQVESINLSSDVLEPEPHSIQQVAAGASLIELGAGPSLIELGGG